VCRLCGTPQPDLSTAHRSRTSRAIRPDDEQASSKRVGRRRLPRHGSCKRLKRAFSRRCGSDRIRLPASSNRMCIRMDLLRVLPHDDSLPPAPRNEPELSLRRDAPPERHLRSRLQSTALPQRSRLRGALQRICRGHGRAFRGCMPLRPSESCSLAAVYSRRGVAMERGPRASGGTPEDTFCAPPTRDSPSVGTVPR
jgi:hypothetical protein